MPRVPIRFALLVGSAELDLDAELTFARKTYPTARIVVVLCREPTCRTCRRARELGIPVETFDLRRLEDLPRIEELLVQHYRVEGVIYTTPHEHLRLVEPSMFLRRTQFTN